MSERECPACHRLLSDNTGPARYWCDHCQWEISIAPLDLLTVYTISDQVLVIVDETVWAEGEWNQ